jgi:phenylacetate-CoA ligase
VENRHRLRLAWDTVRLAETIKHGYENTDFYKKLWSSRGLASADFADRASLEHFPSFEKSEISADPSSLVSRIDIPDQIRDTSGTTGIRLPVYMNSAEDSAMQKMIAGRSSGHPKPNLLLRMLPPPRRIVPQSNAAPDNSVGMIALHVLPGYDPSVWYDSTDMLIAVLLEKYFVATGRQSVDLIHTTPPPLFDYVSGEIVRRGIDPGVFGISEILLTGGPLAPATRANLSKTWGAKILTSYSCTEVRGEALECPHDPNVFHPSPCMIAEVIDPLSGKHVGNKEVGTVALTGLFPFQRVMPMIRYCPGDVAQFHDAPCTCGSSTVGIRLIGRKGHVLDLSEAAGQPLYLGTQYLLGAIGDHAQIPKFPYPRFQAETQTGPAGSRLNIRVESSHPDAFDSAALAISIKRNLCQALPILEELETTRRLEINVFLVPKNSLTEFYKLYPGR